MNWMSLFTMNCTTAPPIPVHMELKDGQKMTIRSSSGTVMIYGYLTRLETRIHISLLTAMAERMKLPTVPFLKTPRADGLPLMRYGYWPPTNPTNPQECFVPILRVAAHQTNYGEEITDYILL